MQGSLFYAFKFTFVKVSLLRAWTLVCRVQVLKAFLVLVLCSSAQRDKRTYS
jgi:hypothetical protein